MPSLISTIFLILLPLIGGVIVNKDVCDLMIAVERVPRLHNQRIAVANRRPQYLRDVIQKLISTLTVAGDKTRIGLTTVDTKIDEQLKLSEGVVAKEVERHLIRINIAGNHPSMDGKTLIQELSYLFSESRGDRRKVPNVIVFFALIADLEQYTDDKRWKWSDPWFDQANTIIVAMPTYNREPRRVYVRNVKGEKRLDVASVDDVARTIHDSLVEVLTLCPFNETLSPCFLDKSKWCVQNVSRLPTNLLPKSWLKYCLRDEIVSCPKGEKECDLRCKAIINNVAWEKCDKECGGGFQKGKMIKTEPAEHWENCPDLNYDPTRYCNPQACPKKPINGTTTPVNDKGKKLTGQPTTDSTPLAADVFLIVVGVLTCLIAVADFGGIVSKNEKCVSADVADRSKSIESQKNRSTPGVETENEPGPSISMFVTSDPE